jgi:hypothetical protein
VQEDSCNVAASPHFDPRVAAPSARHHRWDSSYSIMDLARPGPATIHDPGCVSHAIEPHCSDCGLKLHSYKEYAQFGFDFLNLFQLVFFCLPRHGHEELPTVYIAFLIIAALMFNAKALRRRSRYRVFEYTAAYDDEVRLTYPLPFNTRGGYAADAFKK